MVVSLFKRNIPALLFLLLLIAFALWIVPYMKGIHPQASESPQTWLYLLIHKYMNPRPYLEMALSLGLLLMEALFLNRIVDKNNFLPRNNYLTALSYVIICSGFGPSLYLSPVLLSNLFIICSLYFLFSMYGKEIYYIPTFNASLMISFASLFYLPSLFLIGFVWVTLFLYRVFSVRKFVISVLGLITPYVFIAVYMFWNDMLLELFRVEAFAPFFVYSAQLVQLTSGQLILAGLLLFILLISLFRMFRELNEKIIRIRKFLYVLSWLTFLIFGISLFSKDWVFYFSVFAAVPASVFFSNQLCQMKKGWMAEGIVWLLLICMFITRF